jgi:hypothetical protein
MQSLASFCRLELEEDVLPHSPNTHDLFAFCMLIMARSLTWTTKVSRFHSLLIPRSYRSGLQTNLNLSRTPTMHQF